MLFVQSELLASPREWPSGLSSWGGHMEALGSAERGAGAEETGRACRCRSSGCGPDTGGGEKLPKLDAPEDI